MKKYLLVLVAVLVALTSCSKNSTYTVEEKDGIMNFSNSGAPAEIGFDPALNLTLKISGSSEEGEDNDRIFSRISDLLVDSEGSIYIADGQSFSVKKFNSEGVFIKSFGRQGSGPGELEFMGDVSIFNDTIYVFDQASYKRVKFNSDGEFLGTKVFPRDKECIFLEQVNKENNLALKMIFNMLDGIVNLTVEVQMYDSKYNELFSIEKRSLEIDTNNLQINPTDMFTPVCFSDKYIFVAEVNENLFKYNVYDLEGKLEQVIKMNYKKSEISKDRIELFKSAHRNSDGTSLNNLERAYNKAIEDIYCDKFDRVWVKKAQTDESLAGGYVEFSIFKNGVYLNNYKFKGKVVSNQTMIGKKLFYFVGDKLYVALDEDGEASVNVYDYK